MHGSDAEAIHSTNGLNGVASAAQLDLGLCAAAGERARRSRGGRAADAPSSNATAAIVFFDPMRIERALSRCFAALGREPYTPDPRARAARGQHHVRAARPADGRDRPGRRRADAPGRRRVRGRQGVHPVSRRARQAAPGAARPRRSPRPPSPRPINTFPTPIQKFQFFDKYSRFDYEKGRRETWIETVDRAVSFLHELVQTNTGVDLGGDAVRARAADDPRDEEHAVDAPAGDGRRARPA